MKTKSYFTNHFTKFLFALNIFLTLFAIGVITPSYSQVVNFDDSKECTAFAQLNDYIKIEKEINLADDGIVLLVGAEYGKVPFHIFHFNNEGRLLWKAPIEKEMNGDKRVLLVTPNHKYIYFLGMLAEKFLDKAVHVLRVDRQTGEVKKFEIGDKDEWGKHLLTVACDNSFLFLIASKNGVESDDKKKDTEKLVFNRFDGQTMAYSKTIINTPAINAGAETSFWSFIGQKGDLQMYSSKHFVAESNKVVITLLGITPNGEIKSSLNLNHTLADGKFLAPCALENSPRGSVDEITRVDFEKVVEQHVQSHFTTTQVFARPTAIAHALYDEATDSFFVLGLYGPKKVKKDNDVYQGSYVFKYDWSGNVVWKIDQPAVEESKNKEGTGTPYDPMSRTLGISILGDKFLFTVDKLFDKTLRYIYSFDGKLITSNSIVKPEPNPKLAYGNTREMGLIENLKTVDYIISNLKPKKGYVTSFQNSHGEVLVFLPHKIKNYQTIFFKK